MGVLMDEPAQPEASTGLFGVLGFPVTHSLSPAIHSTFYRRHNLDAIYIPVEVRPEGLPTFMDGLRECRFRGLNVTYPFKNSMVGSLARLDDRARTLGAVNTLTLLPTGLPPGSPPGTVPYEGFNTDGEGLCLYLERELKYSLSNVVMVVLGAGSAARSVVLSVLERAPARVIVVNRSRERLEEPFFKDLKAQGQPLTTGCLTDLDPVRFSRLLGLTTLLIHATPAGLAGQGASFPWPLEGLRPEALVVDLNYQKGKKTAFLNSIPAGRWAVDGKGMLVYQAAEAFRLWWGYTPDVAGLVDSFP